MSDVQVQVGSGTPASARLIHRCSECFMELYEADRGYGSTALACPTHGFDRQIVTVAHPDVARRYEDK